MNINDILTEIEYTKKRSAKELFEWFSLKKEELRAWSQEHSKTKGLRKMKYRELSKGLPRKFAYELFPFAYYAKTYYSNITTARFKPCCGSEQYDGIIINNGNEIFVEIANSIDGKTWGLQKELLIEDGGSCWEHNIQGVGGNRTKRNRSVSDIKISEKSPPHAIIIDKIKKLAERAVSEKCKKSIEQKVPYGQNKTILIVTFADTCFTEEEWNDLIVFKETKIDSTEHNFKKIVLFGRIDNKFIT